MHSSITTAQKPLILLQKTPSVDRGARATCSGLDPGYLAGHDNIQIPVMVLHAPAKFSAAKDGLEPSKRSLKVRLIRPLLR